MNQKRNRHRESCWSTWGNKGCGGSLSCLLQVAIFPILPLSDDSCQLEVGWPVWEVMTAFQMPLSERTRSEGAEWRVPCKLCLAALAVISEVRTLEKSLTDPCRPGGSGAALCSCGPLVLCRRRPRSQRPSPSPFVTDHHLRPAKVLSNTESEPAAGGPYKSEERSVLRTAPVETIAAPSRGSRACAVASAAAPGGLLSL